MGAGWGGACVYTGSSSRALTAHLKLQTEVVVLVLVHLMVETLQMGVHFLTHTGLGQGAAGVWDQEEPGAAARGEGAGAWSPVSTNVGVGAFAGALWHYQCRMQ